MIAAGPGTHSRTRRGDRYLSAVLAGAAAAMLLKLAHHGYSLRSWPLSEWLINYAGGFVRRGLSGELVLAIARSMEISPYWVVFAASLTALFISTWVIVRKGRSHFRSYIFFSPVLFGGVVLGDSWLRKDLIGILSLVICLKWLFRHGQRAGIVPAIVVNAASVSAILVHEAYAFYALPLLVLVIAACRPRRDRAGIGFASIARAVALLSPAVAAFVLVLIRNGTPAAAVAIQQSWAQFAFPYDVAQSAPVAPVAAIAAIGWTLEDGMKLPLSQLGHLQHGIYLPLVWLASIYLSAAFMIGSLKTRGAESVAGAEGVADEGRGFRTMLLIELVSVAPLFVLGWDYGRWIILWGLASVVFFVYTPPAIVDVLARSPLLARAGRPPRWLKSPDRYWLLAFGIPSCCWTFWGYAISTPAGSVAFLMVRAGQNIIRGCPLCPGQ